MSKKLPYARGEWPLLGCLPALLRDRLAFLRECAREYDEACGFHLALVDSILLLKSEQLQSVLVEHAYDFSKGALMHKAIGGNGLFISEGEFHRKQRKLMAPSFQPRHIVSYADTMTRYGEQMQQQWHSGEEIDLNKAMTAVTLSIVGKTLFDADVFDETDAFSAAFVVTFEYTSTTFTSPLRPPLNWPTPYNLRVQKAMRQITERLQQMIDERHRSGTDGRNDLLSVLLNARDEDGEPMSSQQLMDECTTLFAAGHETTAASLTWAWYLLCQHPDIYKKVQEEVDGVLQGRTPTYADLERLPYCRQVFKEVMRLYPPAFSFTREALRDMEIDGYRVPKGMMVMISPYVMHYKPEYFPDPERFDPDRFTPEREKQLPRYAYIPFGAGPRICIGNYFALMEGQLLLATLAQRVSFEILPGQVVKPEMNKTLTLRPYGPVRAVVHRR
ncbi:MAG: cytochrome P450 [Ktedonobacteraceae bacterium]|nr:cytochrome P450 [Ktedonobacteraceae bacterium]